MKKQLLKLFFFAAILMMVFALAPHAMAQSTFDPKSATEDPTTSSNVGTGLNEVLRYTFAFLKFLAIVACGYGSYEMWKGELSKGVWAYVAALALFFAPALVNLAQTIGKTAVAVNTSPAGIERMA